MEVIVMISCSLKMKKNGDNKQLYLSQTVKGFRAV